jgi:hypothetical protein
MYNYVYLLNINMNMFISGVCPQLFLNSTVAQLSSPRIKQPALIR